MTTPSLPPTPPLSLLVFPPPQARNVEWSTVTLAAAWGVQGIWGRASTGADITTLDRSHTQTAVVTGDAHGLVSMYQYPAHVGAGRRMFGGHAGVVSAARFIYDDTRLVTVGADGTVFQWRVAVVA